MIDFFCKIMTASNFCDDRKSALRDGEINKQSCLTDNAGQLAKAILKRLNWRLTCFSLMFREIPQLLIFGERLQRGMLSIKDSVLI